MMLPKRKKNMKKYNVGIVGAAGYTGGELLRILLFHEHIGTINPMSKSNSHAPVTKVHRDLLGDTDLHFSSQLIGNEDVIFLCSGHGESKKWLAENSIGSHKVLIDLSQDFRLDRVEFAYGLSELFPLEISTAKQIANPGCFATLIQLMLAPLAKNNLLGSDVEIAATTGSTGAGQSPTEQTHYSWRSNNASAYKVLAHQHLAEIELTLHNLQLNWKGNINMIPLRGAFTRGIHAVAHLEINNDFNEIENHYAALYESSSFVHVTVDAPDVKQVVNTNKCFIHLEKIGSRLIITGVLDNLLKGASGQAVQNMNIALGLPETSGLKLKPSAF